MSPAKGRSCPSCRREAIPVPEAVSGERQDSGSRLRAGGVLGLLLLLALQSAGCTALVVGGAGQPGSYPAGQSDEARAADERISTSVRSMLAGEADLQQANIEVATRDGIVTLKGLVADYGARSQAELLAASVRGVRGINNRLAVSAQR